MSDVDKKHPTKSASQCLPVLKNITKSTSNYAIDSDRTSNRPTYIGLIVSPRIIQCAWMICMTYFR